MNSALEMYLNSDLPLSSDELPKVWQGHESTPQEDNSHTDRFSFSDFPTISKMDYIALDEIEFNLTISTTEAAEWWKKWIKKKYDLPVKVDNYSYTSVTERMLRTVRESVLRRHESLETMENDVEKA